MNDDSNNTDMGFLPEDWDDISFADTVRRQRIRVGKVKQRDYKTIGCFPIIDQGQLPIAGYWDDEPDVYQGPLPVIIFGDHTRIFKFVSFPFVCGADGTKVLLPDTTKFEPSFLFYALLNLNIPSRGYNRHFHLLKEQSLPQPPIPEQRKIAAVLSAVQEAKEKTEAVIKATKELKKSLMKHLFTYGPVPVEEAENVPLKETEIGLMQEEWDVVHLGDIFNTQQGKAMSPKSRRGISPRPFLRTANVLWGRLDLSALDYMDFTDEEMEKLDLQDGDLLVCEGGQVGRTAMWQGEIESCSYQNHIHRLRSKREDVWSEFFMYWMHTAFAILDLYTGREIRTTIPNLSSGRLKSFPVPFPTVSVQKAVATILSAVSSRIEAEENKKKALEELFKTLLNYLMTAKIRVNDLELDV